MGEIAAIAIKFGVAALPWIISEWGVFAAVTAFFVFMPIGHFTIGVLFIITAVFCPVIPRDNERHELDLTSGKASMRLKGSPRTVLFGIGALIALGSLGEAIFRLTP